MKSKKKSNCTMRVRLPEGLLHRVAKRTQNQGVSLEDHIVRLVKSDTQEPTRTIKIGLPQSMVKALDQGVKSLRTDRSKFIRAAILEKQARLCRATLSQNPKPHSKTLS